MVDRGRRLVDFPHNIQSMEPRIARLDTPTDSISLLDPSFEPGSWDVICQGGKESYDHVGNRRFRLCISNNLDTYQKAKSKHNKSAVVSCIVDAVRGCRYNDTGGFVRKDLVTKQWYEVSDKMAREKVGHALRGAISQQKKITGYDPVSSMMHGAIGAAAAAATAATDDDSQTKETAQDQTSSRPSVKRPLPGRESIPFSLSCSSSTLKVPASTPACASLLDERSYKKLKVKPLTAASLTESARNEEELPMTKSAWEDSLKDSSAIFNYDSSFSDDEDDDEESNKTKAGPVPSNPAVAAVAAPVAAGKPLAWKPPGASGLEASFMRYLNAFQPKPLKEDGCCTEKKVIAGFPSSTPMTAPLTASSVSTASTASLASSLGATGCSTGLPASIAQQQSLGGLSSASAKTNNAPFSAIPEDGGQRRSSLDGNIICTAGLANLVVDDDIFQT